MKRNKEDKKSAALAFVIIPQIFSFSMIALYSFTINYPLWFIITFIILQIVSLIYGLATRKKDITVTHLYKNTERGSENVHGKIMLMFLIVHFYILFCHHLFAEFLNRPNGAYSYAQAFTHGFCYILASTTLWWLTSWFFYVVFKISTKWISLEHLIFSFIILFIILGFAVAFAFVNGYRHLWTDLYGSNTQAQHFYNVSGVLCTILGLIILVAINAYTTKSKLLILRATNFFFYELDEF